METKKVVVKTHRAYATRVTCLVNGKRVMISVSKDIFNEAEAEKYVKLSFGPGAKNLQVTNISLEKLF